MVPTRIGNRFTSQEESPQISIFDAKFVNDTVYTGDTLTRGNRERHTEFVVGAASVEIQRKVDWITRLRNKVERVEHSSRATITEQLPSSIGFETFLGLVPSANAKIIQDQLGTARKLRDQLATRAASLHDILAYHQPGFPLRGIPHPTIENHI